MNAIPKTLNVLYSSNDIPISLPIYQKMYVLAFPLRTLAVKAQKFITPVTRPQMYVSRHIVSRGVNDVLHELGLDNEIYKISERYVQNEAHLHIPKYDDEPCFELSEHSLVDMMLYPFVKNIGLILPLGIVEENHDELIFESQLVEPSVNLELFRKDLEKSIF